LDRNLAVCNDPHAVKALDAYIACRPPGALGPVEKAKHFFRKIARPTAQGKLKMSWDAQNIGKSKLAEQGKFIAKLLKLPN
jgi:hypothetical protein